MDTYRSYLSILCGLWLCLCGSGRAHQEPTSTMEIDLEANAVSVALLASATDLAHDLPEIEPLMLLDTAVLSQHQDRLAPLVLSRLSLQIGGQSLVGKLVSAEPVPEKEDVRLRFSFPVLKSPEVLSLACELFPYDPRHQTFVSVTSGGQLIAQETFHGRSQLREIVVSQQRSVWATAWEFILQGVHHIFIGVDHILFVVGLILLGGTLKRLLAIVSAFTVAHSLTLLLATFGWVSPSPQVIEPLIALSIVIVGAHAWLHQGRADHRMGLAFGLGLLHGFGFASVLQDLTLPASAFVLSVASFNIGVEVGQAAILLSLVPVLAWARRLWPRAVQTSLATVALGLVTIGSYWVVTRIIAT